MSDVKFNQYDTYAQNNYISRMKSIEQTTYHPEIGAMHSLSLELTTKILDILFTQSNFQRFPDFLVHYELAIEDLLRQFRTNEQYGYPGRSPHQKNTGTPFPDYKIKALEDLERRRLERSLDIPF